MTRPADDSRLREALRAAPRAEPTDDQVAEVLRRARRRGGAGTRRLVAVVTVLVVALAALALPPGRSAIASVVGELQSFFQGGAAPGGGRAPLDIDVVLGDVAPGSSRVLVSRGELRLIAYRMTETGWPCVSLGPAASECADGDRWATRTAGHAVVALGTTPAADPRAVVLWGLAGDGVARVNVIDARGRAVRATLGTNAFLVVVPPGRTPATLVAHDRTGGVMERAELGDHVPRVCAGGGPCPRG